MSKYEGKTINEMFDEDFDLLEREMEDVDEIYVKTKDIFMNFVSNGVDFRSVNNVQKLIESLTNLKGTKFNLVKERINVKKLMDDSNLKRARVEADSASEGSIRQLLDAIDDLQDNPLSTSKNINMNQEFDDPEEIEALLNSRVTRPEPTKEDILEQVEEEDDFLEPEIENDISHEEEINAREINSIKELSSGESIVITEYQELFLLDSEGYLVDDIEIDIPIREVYNDEGEFESFVSVETGEVIEIVELED